ncbi:MAG TPA: hypothetical protein VFY71_05840 [Planctomycetota bacterium]|nr:hypothetical protein [Planctomycetota bacterium]
MSALLVLLVHLTQLLAGWLLLGALAPEHARRWTAAVPRALLLGPLAIALEMLLASALHVPFGLAVLLLPWWLAAAVVARRRRAAAAMEPAVTGREHLAALTLVVALATMALTSGLAQPLVAGDGMSNSGLVARVYEVQRSLDLHAVARLRAESYTSYPPLVPLNEALVFLAAGDARSWLVKPFFALALLALMLLLVEACFARLPPRRALLAALLLLLTPVLASGGTSGYLDELFTAWVLLAALTADELRGAPTPGRALLLAAAGAGALLTKPQGVLVGLLCVGWLVVLLARRRLEPRAGAPALLGLLAIGALWPLLVAAYGLSAPMSLAPELSDTLALVGRTARALGMALASVLPLDTFRFQTWGLTWLAGLLLAALALVRRASRARTSAWLLAGAVQLGGCAFTVAAIPVDFEWAFQTGLSRWMLHLLPWLALAALPALEERDVERAAP